MTVPVSPTPTKSRGASSPSILIVTAADLWRNPRVVKEARTLASAGFAVEVATISTGKESLVRDAALLAGSGVQHTVLAQPDGTLGLRAASFAQRAAAKVARWAKRRFGREFPAALGPSRALFRHSMRRNPSLTIGHVEAGLLAVGALARRGRRVAFDFEDWHSEDLLPADRGWRPIRLLRRHEKEAVLQSRYWSGPSEGMIRALRSQAKVDSGGVIIRNCFPLLPLPGERSGARDAPLKVVWFSQTIGPGRGLEWLVRAWATMLAPRRLTLVGAVRADYKETLLRGMPEDLREQIRFPGVLLEHELNVELLSQDVGLALEEATPQSRNLTITNKLFQYLNASLAVVATPTEGQREILDRWPGVGFLVDPASDPAGDACARQLDALAMNRVRLDDCQRASRLAAETELCWERESIKLLRAVEGALS